ncbi:DUF6228 family protein [Gemmata sp. JC717]|uniref:DUF6228 family protein n=1 Tax=Gemmata algarum TaxID=2975278 RepID=UPI0021BA4EDD|nr:DUF6228 family protein [Gemmata algarum]MDY3555825.1 DUF6228 family protein [Gemmata algarum]
MGEPASEVVIADAHRPAVVRLGFDVHCIRVWLEDPPQIRVSSTVYAEFARELAAFFRDLAGQPPAGAEERRVSSSDDELCIQAWADRAGLVGLGLSLASDMWDPNWVVRVNLRVAVAGLPEVAAAIERLAVLAEE